MFEPFLHVSVDEASSVCKGFKRLVSSLLQHKHQKFSGSIVDERLIFSSFDDIFPKKVLSVSSVCSFFSSGSVLVSEVLGNMKDADGSGGGC